MEIPKDAKKVFGGILFDVYQWPQKMFDGSTVTFERLKRPNTVEVIAVQGDKIIMCQQEQPHRGSCFSLFGGRQDGDEDPLVTGKRELLEEAGLVSDDWELFKSFQPQDKIDWTVYVYIARNCTKAAEPNLDGGEKITSLEVDFEGFLDNICHESFWGHDIAMEVMRARLDPQKLEQLRKRIFGEQ